MAIQDEMYKMIEKIIDRVVRENPEKAALINVEKAKEVAKMLSDLSVDKTDSDSLVNQYMANIKNICNL